MEDHEVSKESLLLSKAKIIAERNERFAIIREELEFLKDDLSSRLTQLSYKINNALSE